MEVLAVIKGLGELLKEALSPPAFFNHVCQWGSHEVDGNSEDGAAHAGTSQAVLTAGLAGNLLVERYD